MLRILCLCLCSLFTQILQAQEPQPLNSFDELELRGNISVLLIPSDKTAMLIESGEKHRVEYSNNGDRLLIKHQNILSPSGWEDCRAVEIKVYYQEISSIRAIAGAEVETMGILTGNLLDLHFASGASGILEMDVEKSNLVLKQGAELEIDGTVQRFNGKVITGGELDAYAVKCKRAKIKVTTGGDACITANESLDATARTGGCLTYNGEPAEVVAHYSLWGTIESRF